MFDLTTTEFVPPQSIEAEESILGGILLDPEAMGRISEVLNPQAFYIHAHAQIYSAALALSSDNKPVDLMTVTIWLKDQDKLESAGGQTKLAQLVERTVSAVNIDALVALVMEKYRRRQLIKAGNEIAKLGYETATEFESILNDSEQKIFNITQQRDDNSGQAKPNDQVAAEAWSFLESESKIYKTGLHDLDGLMGGFESGTLTVLAGRPSMGKSQIGLYLAHQMICLHNLPVIFFSL